MLQQRIATLLRRLHQEQRGQVFMLVVGLLSVFGGMSATAVDLGSYMAARRDLQNSTDAIALAASLELPDASAARAVADEWAVKNGIDLNDLTVTIIPQSLPGQPNPEVHVKVSASHGFTFARLIGISSAIVSTTSGAIKTSPAGGDGIVPLSVTQAGLEGAALGSLVTLKYDANDITQGNTNPIRIDAPGGGNCNGTQIEDYHYCQGVMVGSDNTICADGADDTYCDGPTTVETEPGNKIGDTKSAIEYRLNNTSSQCDEFTETFEDDPTTAEQGVYRIRQECNPFLAGRYDSARILIVPVIDQVCAGSCEVTIVNFALFFLEGFGSGGCTGNDCEIVGRFVRVNQNVGLLAGTYNATAYNHFVRLVD